MDNSLREWIASSLLAGYQTDQLRQTLLHCGFSAEAIEQEFAWAAPYIKTAQTLKRQLGAREGLMKTLDRQMRALPHYLTVEKTALPPYAQFMEQYYYPNRPGLFHNVLEHSEARHWTPRGLLSKIGADTVVQIQYEYGTLGDERYQQNAEQFGKMIRFGEFIDMVETTESSNRFYLSAGNYTHNNTALAALKDDIKDIGDGYFAPECNDQRMYFLIGPRGTQTALHFDCVNNMLIQIYGRKRVRLVPALQVPYLYHSSSTHSDVDLRDPQPGIHPEFLEATIIDLELGPGDCLFIPVGWWHHVVSLSPSISLVCTHIKTSEACPNRFIDNSVLFRHLAQYQK
ncbi:MAG TPA: cupin-like domain-containing protein [Rickettsiales bacterium]|nr:cupin-like domain-containing protein [Rickettsiales bacterium]